MQMLLIFLKVVLFILVFFRIFGAITVDTALTFDWPIAFSNFSAQNCANKAFPAWCERSLELRKFLDMDFEPYLQLDPIFAAMDATSKIVYKQYLLLFTPLCMLVAVFPYALRTLGIFTSAMMLQSIVPKLIATLLVTEHVNAILAMNAPDIALPIVMFLVCYFSSAAAAVPVAAKKKQT